MVPLKVIDISNYQGQVDWTVPKGVDASICKVTEGTGFVDQYAQRNWAGAANQKLLRGAYHFVDFFDPVAEAAHFANGIASLGGLAVGDIAAIDIEVVPPSMMNAAKWLLSMAREFRARTGVKPWIYTFYSYVQEYLNDPALADYPLWIADIASAVPPPPPPWKLISMWQYSWKGAVPGISGNVDQDSFFGTADQFRALGRQAVVERVRGQTGIKRSPYHGGPNVLTIPDGALVTLTGPTRMGFTQVTYDGVTGWVASSHLVGR